MEIKIEKSLVEFTPGSDEEKEQLSALWDKIVDCVKFNKKLVPLGEYVAAKENVARFTIE